MCRCHEHLYKRLCLRFQACKWSSARHCPTDARLARPNDSPSSCAPGSRLSHTLSLALHFTSASPPRVYTEISYHGSNAHFSGEWCNWVSFHIFIGHFNILFMNCVVKSLSIFSIGLSLCIWRIRHLLNYITFSWWLKYADTLARPWDFIDDFPQPGHFRHFRLCLPKQRTWDQLMELRILKHRHFHCLGQSIILMFLLSY